ncbi:signal peptide peptidase SppA [Kingella oralis]|jgi:signal peptide peptidase sppA, 36K type|uniref:signal peptide peptidase SppA n=1 Tax=Kingella oralis TaxID=505 RepID=UPI002D7FA6E0|nr:signal peptide peptidase SppA [Kingella oralis]
MPFRRRNPEQSLPVDDEKWAQTTLKDVLFAAYQEQRRARLWRNIWRGVWVLIFLAILAGSRGNNGNAHHNGAASKFATMQKPHTAVVNLKGVIGGNDEHDQVKILREGMEAAYKNNNVKAILLRANSPGGSPVVSNIAFEEIRRMKREHADIPVYVVAEDVCASGCYYIAAAADKIYADPSSLMGSIGVIGSSFDVTELMQKIGVKRRVRIAGDNKGMGDPFTPESPEQQAIFQQMLDQVHAEFIKSVREGRNGKLNEKAYPDLFSGRVFTGIEAKKAGLVDDLGNIYSVARDVVKAPDLVDYTPENNDLASLLQRGLGARVQLKLEEWLQQGW